MENNMKNITRRQFISTAGSTTIMIGGIYLLSGCKQDNGQTSGNAELIEKEIT